MNYNHMPYQPQYAVPTISYSPPLYSSSPNPNISYSSSPHLSFIQPSQSSSDTTSRASSTLLQEPPNSSFNTFASMASTVPIPSIDAFGNFVAPAIPATSDIQDTQATQDNTDDKEHIFINIIIADTDSNNSTVVKKKEIDIKGELNKDTDYTFYIIITDKDKKKFYLYAEEDSYNKSTISKNADDEYNDILKDYKDPGDYCIIIYEKNCLIVWYNTQIDKTDIYKKIENKKKKEGQTNSKLNFISNYADKQNIMHNFLSNYVSTRFLENKFFKVIQNFSNTYIKNFINELDVCNN
jgi:hypothetical protein